MAGLENCPKCGTLYVKNNLRDVCNNCYKEEEKMYDVVSKFLRIKENRAATISSVVEATGVEEELIFKWVRKGRLRSTQFPNLGYPCSKCGTIIKEGSLCTSCISGIRKDLNQFEETEKLKLQNTKQVIYHRR